MTFPVETYSRVMRVLELISQGRTPTAACDDQRIAWSTVRKYLEQNTELQEAFNDAEQRGIDTLADILLDINGHHHYGTTDVAKQKVISDNIKWYISRKRPKQYGDRVVVENTFTMDRVVLDALERGKQRALAGRVLDAVAEEVTEAVMSNAVVLVTPEKGVDEYDFSEFYD